MKAKIKDVHKPWYKVKAKRNTVLVSSVFILLMVTSALSLYGGKNNAKTASYKGEKFVLTEKNMWGIYIDDQPYLFQNNPNDLGNVTITRPNLEQFFNDDKIYVSFDQTTSKSSALSLLLYTLAKKGVNARFVNACQEDSNLCTNLPLKTCEDTDESDGVIMLKDSDTYNVQFEDNCLIIEGPDARKAVEKLVLEMIL